jgi:3-dehydroquinate dehydratase/shikimate dehydrogenase
MICVSIGRTRHKMMSLEHRHLAEQGAELVELRLDWLSRQPDLPRLLNDRPTPTIVTCRRTKDRGRWRGNEEQRLALLRAAIVAGVEYVDLEDDVAAKIPRYGKTRRIVSAHDFDETPQDLEAIHGKLAKLDPDIVKIVTMANAPSDCVRMLRLVANASVPTIGFCMGELGQPSRILCGKYGAPFTYATFSRDREMAPGQLAFEEMQRVYRYNDINSSTRAFGVLGDPIAHSLSPLIHNAAYRALGMNAVYLPLRVLRGTLPETLQALEFLEFQGYSVTIPHKEAAIEHAPDCDPQAREIGAANTLYRDATGQWRATNSDYDAALDSLREALVTDAEPAGRIRGKKVLMLGAGGVARAIGLGIAREGGLLTISNRTSDRAKTLAEELGCQSIQWENRGTVFSDVLVNCTSVGMHPNVDETPFAANWLREGMVVFDTIYNPENTLLLKQARERDCRIVSGVEMFVRQAAVQFQLFTGQPAPLDAMRGAMRQGISPVKVRL